MTILFTLCAVVAVAGTIYAVRVFLLGRRLKSLRHETLLGEWAKVETPLCPSGWVRVRGKRRRARSSTHLQPDEAVRIVALGEDLRVEPWA